MSGFENHESIDPPNQRPELGLYLEANQDIDPSSLVVLHHIPVLLGGAKSSQFIIREQGADDDTPPNPDARIDLGEVAVPRTGLAASS